MPTSYFKPKRLLHLSHRWLGITGCLLFMAWFLSGLVMMYMPYPRLNEPARLQHLPALDLSTCCLPLAQVSVANSLGTVNALRLAMVGGRPVYHLTDSNGKQGSFYADQHGVVAPVDYRQAMQTAAGHWGHALGELEYRGLIHSDQWTVYRRYNAHRPLHHIAANNRVGGESYVSSQTGEVVLTTERMERAWNWVGAVTHWLYFRPLREQQPVWSQLVIWLSVAGCLLAVSGLVVGAMRLRPRRRYKGGRISPYRGLMSLHIWGGVFFGFITLAWVFSGLLSMNPWGLFQRAVITPDERVLLTGGALHVEDFPLAPQDALQSVAGAVKEIRWLRFDGEPYYRLLAADGASTLVHAVTGEAMTALLPARVEAVALRLMPGKVPATVEWLTEYDSYYYDRRNARSLPVLRLTWDDPDQTWHYINPADGTIAAKLNQSSRVYRWLFNALHSWDFAFLVRNRPLWDVWVIVLSLGGLLLVGTGTVAAGRRLRQSHRARNHHAARNRYERHHTPDAVDKLSPGH